MSGKDCPKCSSQMVDGYIVDQGYGTNSVPSWREGEPRKSIWVGLKLGGTKPLETRPIAADAAGISRAMPPARPFVRIHPRGSEPI